MMSAADRYSFLSSLGRLLLAHFNNKMTLAFPLSSALSSPLFSLFLSHLSPSPSPHLLLAPYLLVLQLFRRNFAPFHPHGLLHFPLSKTERET